MRVLVCAAACMAACALPGSTQAPTAAQVLAARMAAFAAAKTVTMVGHVSFGGVTYPVSLRVDDHGQASGSVGLDRALVGALLAGGRTFLRDAGYYSSHGLATGGQWVLESDGTVVNLLAKLADRKGLVAALVAAAGSGVVQGPGADAGGVKTVKLASPDVSVTVPAAGGPPTRVVTGVDTQLAGGFSDVQLDLSDYGVAASIAAPDAFLDRSQPDTWPASYVRVTGPDTPFSYDGCDRSGCTLSASFHNLGGKVGSATATFYVSREGTTLGSCDVPIPAAAHDAVVRTGCRVTFTYDARFTGNAQVHNPQ
jgi:hypothetical protein